MKSRSIRSLIALLHTWFLKPSCLILLKMSFLILIPPQLFIIFLHPFLWTATLPPAQRRGPSPNLREGLPLPRSMTPLLTTFVKDHYSGSGSRTLRTILAVEPKRRTSPLLARYPTSPNAKIFGIHRHDASGVLRHEWVYRSESVVPYLWASPYLLLPWRLGLLGTFSSWFALPSPSAN